MVRFKLRNKHKKRLVFIAVVYVFDCKVIYAIGSVALKSNFVIVVVKNIAVVSV